MCEKFCLVKDAHIIVSDTNVVKPLLDKYYIAAYNIYYVSKSRTFSRLDIKY